MAYRHEDNLPEVVPDSSPQPLTAAEIEERRGVDERDEKYAVVYGPTTKAVAVGAPVATEFSPTPFTPAPPYQSPVGGGAGSPPAVPPVDGGLEAGGAPNGNGEGKASTIFGLKKKTFWIIVIAAVIIIAVAVGGGVGGSAAARDKSQKNSEAAEATESVATSTTETPSYTSTSSSASPTATSDSGDDEDDEDDDNLSQPGFEFRGWEDPDFEGEDTGFVLQIGFTDLPFNVTSYTWDPNNTECCVTMCQGNDTMVGWRCTKFEREEATASFGRLYVGCGEDAAEENARCS